MILGTLFVFYTWMAALPCHAPLLPVLILFLILLYLQCSLVLPFGGMKGNLSLEKGKGLVRSTSVLYIELDQLIFVYRRTIWWEAIWKAEAHHLDGFLLMISLSSFLTTDNLSKRRGWCCWAGPTVVSCEVESLQTLKWNLIFSLFFGLWEGLSLPRVSLALAIITLQHVVLYVFTCGRPTFNELILVLRDTNYTLLFCWVIIFCF